ncbi:MAG: efflux RND transporter periplasmic adaptor subunit [Phycisphaeraceae bacterium]
MNPRTLPIIFLVALAALVAGGCRDDHSGHDHAAETRPASEEHQHGDDADGGHGKAGDHAEQGDDGAAHADEVTLTAVAIKRWGVRTEPLTRHALPQTLTVPARVSFNAEAIAHIGSVVSGRVSQIKVRVGQNVNAGDVLLVIVSPELGQAQSEYLQKSSAIGTTEATVKVARNLHDRAKALYDESQGIALSEVQKREAEFRGAEGALIAARSAKTAAENALHILGMTQEAVGTLGQTGEINPDYVIRAPFAGRIIEREATLGEAVGPDRDALMVLADLSTLWVIADVPEAHIGEIRTGSKAAVTVPAFRDRRFEGAVTYLDTQLNAATRTIPVRIEVRDVESMLRPGMFALAQIATGDAAGEPVPAIPQVAVQNVEGDTCVFVPVAGEANTFAKRVVRIGPPIGSMVPVLDGLSEGEAYVAQGSFILKADLGKAGAAHEH